MESEWKQHKLSDVGVSLIDCVHKTPADAGEGVPYIGIPQMKDGRIDFDAGPRMISEADYVAWTKKANPTTDDVVLSRRCNPGETAIVKEGDKFALGQNLVLLRCETDAIHPPFLRWVTRGYEWWGQVGKFLNVGAVFDSLRCRDIPSFEVTIPPLTHQKSIAHILGTLDDKIELNRRMNETLESMARALFKSWFVDFDPVIDNALAAGNPIPEPLIQPAQTRRDLGTHRKPLPTHIQKLFPNAFVFDDDMGWIPDGWNACPVSSAITINPRVTLKKGEIAKYADMKALPTSGFAVNTVIEKEYSGGAKYQNNDVLMARITPCLENGKAGVVDYLAEGETGFGSTEFIVLRPQEEIGTPFIAALVRDENFRSHCIANMVGSSGRQRVQNACFGTYFLCLPNEPGVLKQYHDTGVSFFSRISTLKRENNSLAKLRDTLLPKLLSGELRIPDAEKLVAGNL